MKILAVISLFILKIFLFSSVSLDKGQIETITEFYYSTEKNVLEKILHYRYEKNGKILEEKETDSSDKLIKRTVYTYDSQERLLRKDIYDSGQNLIYCSKFSHDKAGQKECRNFVGKKLISKTVSYMNDLGQISRFDTYTAEEVIYNNHFFKFNANGQETEETIAYPDGMIEWKSQSVYDEKGQLKQKNEYPSCCLSIEYSYQYDEKGNLTEEKNIRADSRKGTDYSYTYQEFDKKSNWLVRIISENDKPTTLVKRKIEYFIP